MKSLDFEYDGILLSDIGFMVCKFNSDGTTETVSSVSQITFNTVSTLNGTKHELTSTKYESCIEATFQICKDPCSNDNLFISVRELRDLRRWLNRKGFYKLKLMDDDYLDLYFEASFNVNEIEFNGELCGLELVMRTNRPFALQEPQKTTIKNLTSAGKKVINDLSDEEGFIYPQMEIKIEQSGDLSIHNALEDRTMLIKNCLAGEIITLDYPVIESSITSHKIQEDFNWTFFRIANNFRNNRNEITISLPCTITMTYSPIAKVGI